MIDRLNHAWRWFGTATSFIIFGFGGIVLTLFVFPLLHLLPGPRRKRETRAQLVIHYAFKSYITLMSWLGVLSYETQGLEKLKKADLVMANHPSLIDVVFLIALIPNANCVVKGALNRNPMIRGPVKAAGYIINDSAEGVIDAAKEVFRQGGTLIIFPEGTRTTPGQPLDLKRGASNVAVRTQVDITPVLIECSPTTLTKQDKWYQVPARKVRFLICVKDTISIDHYVDSVSPSKGARMLTRDMNHYFTRELAINEQSAA